MNRSGGGADDVRTPCPRCGFCAAVVFVHGHGQCCACGANVEPCCDGTAPGDAGAMPTHLQTAASPTLFKNVFTTLGGRNATVTRAALEFAVAQRLGTDLEEARLLLEAAERIGIVEPLAAALYRLRADVAATGSPHTVDRPPRQP